MKNQYDIYQRHCFETQEFLNNLTKGNNFQSRNSTQTLSQDNIHQILENRINEINIEYQNRLKDEFFGIGPLKNLLNNENISEIIINGYNSIWIERDGKLLPFEDSFLSEQTFDSFLQRLYLEIGQEPTILHPFIDDSWRGFRIHIIGAYNTHIKSVQITIRKHKRDPWTLSELENNQWMNHSNEFNLLSEIVSNKENILIIGPSSSGKTSVMKALINECKDNERLVIIEDSKELDLPSSSCAQLLTRYDSRGILPPITLSDLVRQSLRMRPDRLIIGEVRGSEAKDLLIALATGHKGSFSTLHASDPWQALIRLEMLIQMGAPHWNTSAIRKLILLSLNYIILCQRKCDGKRELGGIYKLVSLEESGIIIERLNP